MGTAVDRMQGIPEYGPLLAATDSDAVAWCLNWAADCAEDTNRSSEDASYPLRLNINLDSTRNLVARAHVLLEVMSLGRERDREKEKEKEKEKEEMKAYRGSCEFLLLLCDMLSKV